MPSRLSLLATVLFSGVLLRGQSCKSLPSTLLQTISEAVSTRFQLAPDLTIEDQGTVNDSCYRRLMVRSQEPKRAFALYVSPDQRFVTPDLIDLTLSNNAEAQRERNEVSKLLEQGRSPSNGPDKAEVTVVEFSDFQCPYCKRLAYYISRARQEGFTFRLIFKHAPLPQHS